MAVEEHPTPGPESPGNAAELRARLNGETALIGWQELLRPFARGVVQRVLAGCDLVEAAVAFARDDREQVAEWRAQGLLRQVADDEAAAWLEDDAELWAVVVAPFVLVQRPEDAHLQRRQR